MLLFNLLKQRRSLSEKEKHFFSITKFVFWPGSNNMFELLSSVLCFHHTLPVIVIIISTSSLQTMNDNACDYCGVYTGDKNYPCSVCRLVFHKSCVNKLYIKNNQGISLAMAGHRIGDDYWTCHNCVSNALVILSLDYLGLMRKTTLVLSKLENCFVVFIK